MNMENFITGFPANEEAFRKVVYRALGEKKPIYSSTAILKIFFPKRMPFLSILLGSIWSAYRLITAILKTI